MDRPPLYDALDTMVEWLEEQKRKGRNVDQRIMKTRLLCNEGKRWNGITEIGGDNKGQLVELFQKAVNGTAQREAWCMAFVNYCIKAVDIAFDEMLGMSSGMRSRIYPSESVLETWTHTKSECRVMEAEPGDLVLWQHYKDNKGTGLGHAGIVLEKISEEGFLKTVEGNTGPQDKTIEREGDGVYVKSRKIITDAGNMRLLGYLRVW